MNFTFRPALAADIAGMSVVRLAVRENRLSNPDRITPAMYADHLGPLGRSWVCEHDGRIVGFSSAALPTEKSDASIWALFVLPEFEARGIGKRLLALATEWLFAQGAPRIVLGTAAATRADAFYERLGWRRGKMIDAIEVEFVLERAKRWASRRPLFSAGSEQVTLILRLTPASKIGRPRAVTSTRAWSPRDRKFEVEGPAPECARPRSLRSAVLQSGGPNCAPLPCPS